MASHHDHACRSHKPNASSSDTSPTSQAAQCPALTRIVIASGPPPTCTGPLAKIQSPYPSASSAASLIAVGPFIQIAPSPCQFALLEVCSSPLGWRIVGASTLGACEKIHGPT